MTEIKVGDIVTTGWAGFWHVDSINETLREGYGPKYTVSRLYAANGKPRTSKPRAAYYVAPALSRLQRVINNLESQTENLRGIEKQILEEWH